MVRQQFDNLASAVRKEAGEMKSTIDDVARSVNATLGRDFKKIPQRINQPSGINPIKIRRFLVTIIKLLVILEFITAVTEGIGGSWGRLGRDLVLAGVLYVMWDRIKNYVTEQKEAYRRRVELSGVELKLWDGMVFSLLWSDEIYTDIPEDQRRLAVIAYTLIAIGIGALYFGSDLSLLRLIVSASIVLAAVNLLAWVVSRERGEKESLKTELKLAHDVQISLMPKEHPKVEGLDIVGYSNPAKEVGGDHFDYSYLGNEKSKFCISVFDVSGKGMQAAMSAVFTTGLFAGEVKLNQSASDILTNINKPVFTHGKRGHFVAFLLAVIDLQARTLTFANAGQMKPLLISHDSAQWLDSVGISFPLGMKEDSEYGERTVSLQAGDTILFLTDGFTEAMNASREQFGSERIESIVRQIARSASAQDLLRRIKSEVELHVGNAIQHDDMTLVVVKVL